MMNRSAMFILIGMQRHIMHYGTHTKQNIVVVHYVQSSQGRTWIIHWIFKKIWIYVNTLRSTDCREFLKLKYYNNKVELISLSLKVACVFCEKGNWTYSWTFLYIELAEQNWKRRKNVIYSLNYKLFASFSMLKRLLYLQIYLTS